MKKAFLLISLFFLSGIVYSQTGSMLKGPEFVNKNGAFKYVIGEDKTSFYVLRMGTKGSGIQNNIEKCNKKTFELEWVKDIAFESDLGEIPAIAIHQSSIILSRGKIYFFLSLVETRKNSRSVYFKTMNTSDGEVNGKAELLAHSENYGGVEGLRISYSPDTTKALIKFGTEKVKLFEVKTAKEIFDKEIPTSDGTGQLDVTSISVDNIGNILCIYSRKEGFPGIGKIALNSKSMKTFDLNVGVNDHAFLTSNVLQYDDNFDEAIITGIFIDVPCKKKKECEQKEGNYFMKIDLNTSKIVTAKYEYFDNAAHAIYKDLPDSGMNPYEKLSCFNSIIDKTNEDVYSISTSGFNGIIFATRFDKTGKVIWTKAIPRSTILYHPGFVYAFEKGALFFIYLDNPKNINEVDINNFVVKKIKTQGAVAGSNIVCVSVSKEGELKRDVLGNNEKGTVNFMPDYINYISDQPPILNLKYGKNEQYVRFEFKK